MHYNRMGVYFIVFMLFTSCNDRNETVDNSNTILDTTQNTSATLNEKTSENTISTPTAKNEIPTSGVSTNENDSVAVFESKIIYDADFKPFVYTKIKNNMTVSIVAFELLIDPYTESHKNCEEITITKKLNIAPHKTVTIKEKLQYNSESGCKLDFAKINLGEFVLSNGKKTSLQMLFWENINKK